MLIDWVRSGRTGKYLALGHGARTSLCSVRTPWPRAKYFPVRPSYSFNKCIVPTWTAVLHFLSFISSLFDCSYLAVSDQTERTFLSGEEVHVHPVHPSPPCARACLRSLTKEQYPQVEMDHLFKSLVLPKFTYCLSVYGASEPDLNIIQHF